MVCATRKGSDMSAYTRSLSDQSLCWSLAYSMKIKQLTEHHLKFLSSTGLSESIHVKMPHCWKSDVVAQQYSPAEFGRILGGPGT